MTIKDKAPTQNDFISEKMNEFENRFEAIMTYWGSAGIIKEIKDYIGQSLTQQKEAIEKEWVEKIEEIQETLDQDFQNINGTEYTNGFEDGLLKIKQLLH